MGFPVGYTELFLPRLFIHLLSLFGVLRKIISVIFSYVGLPDFIEPDFSTSSHYATNNNHNNNGTAFFSSWSDPSPTRISDLGSAMIRELLPVVRFSELVAAPESCAVCLYEFEGEDEIRRLRNCCHIFHRACLDRWMGYDQKTCPLCRTPFLSEDLIADRLCGFHSFPDLHDSAYYSEEVNITGL